MNRSESSLIAKLFAGYFFNDYIFSKHDALRLFTEDVFQKKIIQPDTEVETTYFLKPKDLVRGGRQAKTRVCEGGQNYKSGNIKNPDEPFALGSAFGNGHFDIAVYQRSTSKGIILLLFEVKNLSDINTGQLLHELELCKSLQTTKLIHNDQEIVFDAVYFISICTFANLHYSRALRVDDKGIVTIPGIGVLPDNVRITTFDKVAETITKTLEISDTHKKIGIDVLKTMYFMSDAKTLTVDGTAKGLPRDLLHSAKKQIEMLGIL